MEREIAAGGRGVEGDERFHAAVTAAGHSRLLAKLMVEISDLIRETRIESLAQPDRPVNSLQGPPQDRRCDPGAETPARPPRPCRRTSKWSVTSRC